MKNKKNKLINSFAISAILAIVFIVFAVIFGELYKPFKNWLAGAFNHHWIGKSVISIMIFYIFGFLCYFKISDREEILIYMLKIVFWTALAGALLITSFYLYEYFLAIHQ
ncbi:hypothetical protein COT82_01790 [Candidatus Campbellbacteria bacterium CG10_big_fil_rev_8_21_14_0_10_35_52]|uniref:Uncharacterized protein n=1 Tax=Candidatus Campbellbacteria bacterium CG10_big_fil_rev_8_21_14_0_10_35_52 TaxID=1974527 RepID=A0A2M6WV87_9BACT|nr:MAG: hypothetical protein COT82_01790 [Candidatus Campbellbacteria bacterium CG10_big_fil_rev_8_21_14_0_10_35_52]